MRRTDREIKENTAIIGVLKECDTLRVSVNGDGYPYTVPVSYGVSEEKGTAAIYFHCAPKGMKIDLIRADGRVCFECDRLIGYEKTAHGITARYRSVIGFGICSVVTDPGEKLAGLECVTAHCGFPAYPVEDCASIGGVSVCRIDVQSITGKENLPG